MMVKVIKTEEELIDHVINRVITSNNIDGLGVSPMMPPSEKVDWFAPAGLIEGVIKNSIKLKWEPVLNGDLPPINTKDCKVTAVILEQSIPKPINYSDITRNICGR